MLLRGRPVPGVRFHYERPVQRILSDTATRRIRGVEVDGERLDYDVVVSNVDVSVTYPDLLEDEEAPAYRRYRALEPSSSGYVFYWGMGEAFDELGLHNIFFSDDYRRAAATGRALAYLRDTRPQRP
ncbi:MAG: hypothetical protein R6W94_11215 [Spirochaetia bacterium]